MPLAPEIAIKRRMGIAASDAAPILGLSPWSSPADVWMQKKHPHLFKDKKMNPSLYWGIKLEAGVADEYALQTNQELISPGLVVSKDRPWMMCQPDRLIYDKKKGLECKTSDSWSGDEWGPSGTDQVPIQYLIQCVHSMVVMDVSEWDLAVLIGGNDFRIYNLFRDEDLVKMMLESEEEFYTRFIKGDETPEFDWGSSVGLAVAKKYPRSNPDKTITIKPSTEPMICSAVDKMMESRARIKDFEKEVDNCKPIIQVYMGDAEEMIVEGEKTRRITWKGGEKVKSEVDYEALFKKMLPLLPLTPIEKRDLIAAHVEKKTSARRFTPYDNYVPKKSKEKKKAK